MMRRLASVAVAMGLVLAACGSDDEGQLASTTDGGDDAAAATDAGDSGDDGESAADDSGDGGDAMTGDSGSDWCDAARAAAEGEDSGIEFNLLGLTPEELEARFDQNVAVVERWESTAPPEIASDVTTMADAFRTLVTLAEDAEWDLLALGTDPAFVEAFDDEELGAAADNIDAYSRDVCGVDLAMAGADSLGGASGVPTIPDPVDGDIAAEFLQAFGLPPNFLDDDQLACVTAELEAEFPDGIPADLTLGPETIALFDEVGSACDIGTP